MFDYKTINAFSLVSRSKEIQLSIPTIDEKDYNHNISIYDLDPLTIKNLKKNADKMGRLLRDSAKQGYD